MYNNGNSATGNRAVSKLLVVLLSVAICAAFMPLLSDSVDAAGKKPGKVKKVTLTVDKNTNKVSVKWKKAKKAKKYEVKVTDGKSKLVASKKTKKKSFSFNGQANTKYTVKVRGIKGKKKGKWSAAKSVTTGKSKGQKDAEKALAEAKAALEQAEKNLKDAQDALEQAKKDHDTDQQTIADLTKKVDEAEKARDEAREALKNAQDASDIVKALEAGDLDNDEILALKDAYEKLSPETKALIPEEMVEELMDKADFVDRQRANGFLVDAVRLSPAKILDECDWWDQDDYNDYAERVDEALNNFDNELTFNQQLLVGLEIRNRLEACEFALEKAAAIVDLNTQSNYAYLDENYFGDEQDAIDEILNGKYNDQGEKTEKGAIDKIKEAESSEDITAIKDAAVDAIAEIATKPEVVTAAINKLSQDYEVITAKNIEAASDAVAAIEEKYADLTWKQKKEVENYDQLISVENRIVAFGLDKDKAKALLAREAVNYYDSEWTEVKAIVTAGEAAIDAATTPEGISDALAQALDKLSAVPTKVEVVRAMIEECVDNYLDVLSDDNIEAARKDVAAATEKYDKDLNDDQREEVYEAEDGLEDDVDRLLDQVDNYDLNKAKDAAIAELDGYYAYEDAYFERAWSAVCDEIENGIEAIEAAETEKDVEKALSDAEKAIDAIPTKPEVVTKRIDTLYDYYNKHGLTVENYTEVKEWAEDVREMYASLTEEEQAAVENIDELETVEAAVEREVGTVVLFVESKIDAINDVKDIVKGRNIVFAALEAYFSVDEDVQALVSNVDVLKDALDELDIEWPESISARILALYDTVDKYDTLKPEEQDKFDDELEAVKAELDEYDAAREHASVNNRVVKKYRQMLKSIYEDIAEIEEMIKDLNDVMGLTLDSGEEAIEEAAEAVADARDAYESANSFVKAKVAEAGYVDDLEAVEKHMASLEEAADVEEMINGLPELEDLELDDAETVEAARDAYDEYLDEYEDDDQVRDDAVETLEAAENRIAALGVEELIGEIPELEDLELDDAETVEAARDAYDTYLDKYETDMVNPDDVDALEAAENKIAALGVEELIGEIPELEDLELDDAETVEAARDAYDTYLDKYETDMVNPDDVTKLVDAEEMIENLEAADVIAEMIEALPQPYEVDPEDDRDAILAAKGAYEQADADVQALVDQNLVRKLEQDVEALNRE